MLFNSYIFLFVFLPITWLVFWSVHRWRRVDVAVGLLLAASLIFYSYWNPPFVLLMLASIAFNFFWGRWMENAPAPSRLRFGTGIAINLAVLGYFKYANFFMDNAAALTGQTWSHWKIYLPLGISFFTFQQITYLADCHKRIAPGNRFTDYALFVTFFPHLIAGPIVQHGDIMPQIKKLRTTIFSSQNIAVGMGFLVLGLFNTTTPF
jgi:alginate O-acetyltransferase complex protein AlgI